MLLLDVIAEQRILEAIDGGALNNLPGAGRPLELDDDVIVPEELRVAYRILKNSGCLPPEVEMLKEIRNLRQLLVAVDEDTRGRAARRVQALLLKLSTARGTEIDLHAEEEYLQRINERFAANTSQANGVRER